ncbi:hypothetical protein K469DRAFT_695103 [Zopfia rhizophila CBS 207.26]|uniref:Uncharacterized protein n=1 Tax=Zopfia rhizophila CBS 207.26 TaxID=1314779 RepID=A0A6A6DHF6_9PEZI|nr:hypothetical protein K469DRAFT_695103 [Zopfia rhizophila CBS 207.26]
MTKLGLASGPAPAPAPTSGAHLLEERYVSPLLSAPTAGQGRRSDPSQGTNCDGYGDTRIYLTGDASDNGDGYGGAKIDLTGDASDNGDGYGDIIIDLTEGASDSE